jgi:hypothetical protein
MTDKAKSWTSEGYRGSVQSCFCIGPQNCEPYCPCMMRAKGVYQRDGRWIEPEKDVGPVQNVRNILEGRTDD